MKKEYDVIIVGSGIIGATAALALARNTKLTIGLVDAKALPEKFALADCPARVSAITPASQRILQRLDVWKNITAKRISPYYKMAVWDAATTGGLNFDSAATQGNALGHIIEDEVIRASLIENFKLYSNLDVLAPVKLQALHEQADAMVLQGEGEQTFRSKLMLAADGANSWVRHKAAITIKNRAYKHDAVVTTVRTTLSHGQTAYQRFLPTGPLAFLPLSDAHTASVVWSTSASKAAHLMGLADQEFCLELGKAFAYRLGDIISASPRQAFNLQMRHANNYVKPGLALVGDAAHTIHPLAGQGVNLGLLDVASLVDVICKALAQNRDFASMSVLRRYERWRKAENVTMLAFVDGIKYLFASENKALQGARALGLNIVDKMQVMKHFFASYAAGNRSSLPVLAKL